MGKQCFIRYNIYALVYIFPCDTTNEQAMLKWIFGLKPDERTSIGVIQEKLEIVNLETLIGWAQLLKTG